MPWNGSEDCDGCRYWSDMIAQAGVGCHSREVEAMCLNKDSPHHHKYTVAQWTCSAFARDTYGKVDSPPDYGEESRALYAEQAALRHPNGTPMYAPDGTMLDENGNRSIFDDIDL